MTDAPSGKAYYYHPGTKESRWDLDDLAGQEVRVPSDVGDRPRYWDWDWQDEENSANNLGQENISIKATGTSISQAAKLIFVEIPLLSFRL